MSVLADVDRQAVGYGRLTGPTACYARLTNVDWRLRIYWEVMLKKHSFMRYVLSVLRTST